MANPNLLSVRNKAQNIAIEAGRVALHSLAPDDFEYYAMSLVLENSYGELLQVFNFPVMPNAIQIAKRPLVNIKKTARGYADVFSSAFSGDTISISGTFGRKFRLLLVNEIKKPNAKKEGIAEEDKVFLKDTFDARVKTGYGSIKLMEKILYASTQRDVYGGVHKLYFFNYAYNEKFFVEVINWSKQQSLENNIMWNYSMELKAIGTADKWIAGQANLQNLLTTSAVQKTFNKTISNMTLGGATDLLQGRL